MIKLSHKHNRAITNNLKDRYNSLEIAKFTEQIEQSFLPQLLEKEEQKLIDNFCKGKRDTLIANICYINAVTKKMGLKGKIRHSGKKNNYMKDTRK